VKVSKSPEFSCAVETSGDETAEAVFRVNPHSADTFEDVAICEGPEIATAA
jgi:hypothetical protein